MGSSAKVCSLHSSSLLVLYIQETAVIVLGVFGSRNLLFYLEVLFPSLMIKSRVLGMLDVFSTTQPHYWLFYCTHTFAFFRSWNHTVCNLSQFTCSSLFSVCCDDNATLTKPRLERKGFISDYSPSLGEAKAGTWSRNHKEMLLTGLLPTFCFPSYFIPCRIPRLGMALPSVAWAFPYYLPIHKWLTDVLIFWSDPGKPSSFR